MASKSASYERRADDWILQHNLAAPEVMQIGRQILTSLIAEQTARHGYENIQQQIVNSQEVDELLREKFTSEETYLWMQGELSRLYYEYYRFALDTARRAERAMKQELMRPELDSQEFVKFDYWDGGRKGLLSGEALHLDLKRMEMAYHEHNRRELELAKHVSLRQLDPVALLALKTTDTCQVRVPEWLFDLDGTGHYMRRIKSVALSIPAVTGPYTSVNCTLSLLRSTVRKSAVGDYSYVRQDGDTDRFVDYAGAIQSVVTSSGQNDSGLFETNLRDERFLPFEGAGAESTWELELPTPTDYPAFDYASISDVILHFRYTARQGVEPGKVRAALDELFGSGDSSQSSLALLLSLRHDFPVEWSRFVNGTGDFAAAVRREHFPYFTTRKRIEVSGLELYSGGDVASRSPLNVPDTASDDLAEPERGQFGFTTAESRGLTRPANTEAFLVVRYTLS